MDKYIIGDTVDVKLVPGGRIIQGEICGTAGSISGEHRYIVDVGVPTIWGNAYSDSPRCGRMYTIIICNNAQIINHVRTNADKALTFYIEAMDRFITYINDVPIIPRITFEEFIESYCSVDEELKNEVWERHLRIKERENSARREKLYDNSYETYLECLEEVMDNGDNCK